MVKRVFARIQESHLYQTKPTKLNPSGTFDPIFSQASYLPNISVLYLTCAYHKHSISCKPSKTMLLSPPNPDFLYPLKNYSLTNPTQPRSPQTRLSIPKKYEASAAKNSNLKPDQSGLGVQNFKSCRRPKTFK